MSVRIRPLPFTLVATIVATIDWPSPDAASGRPRELPAELVETGLDAAARPPLGRTSPQPTLEDGDLLVPLPELAPPSHRSAAL
jgi:hypothetical protein